MGNSLTGISSTAVTPSDFRYGIFSTMPAYVPGCSASLEGLLREAADVHLVDDRFGKRAAEVAVAFPIERVVDDDALGRADDAVVGGQEAAGEGAGVRVDQPGLRIEAVALAGVERAVGLEVVKLTGFEAGNEHAPNIAPAVGLGVELDRVAPARGR